MRRSLEKFSHRVDLSGRLALVTGASGALGKVIAQTLAELGADLVLSDLDAKSLDELAEELSANFSVSITVKSCDLESDKDREALITSLREKGRLDILVNNAAFVGNSDLEGWAVPFPAQSIQTWRRAFEVNLTAVFHLCQGLMPLLENSGKGSILNIGSIYGEYGPAWDLYEGTAMGNPAAYGVSKGGIIQLTRWLATTVAPRVRINTISPGGIYRGQPEAFVTRYIARTPLGRMATEDDLRGVTAFLASDMSAYLTGQNIMVDGGWGIW
jgi:NAD(P)-dependent dehydrogenase (short-subunit alcohol dehydrogenase family)